MIFRIDDTVAGCSSRRLVSQLVNVKLFSSQTLVCVSFNPVIQYIQILSVLFLHSMFK